ncbi:uncharacterized protein LOC113492452 isoform X2 [Trichoplusia ni]|uniref:Uncharacterized protein LOC113492452 isoform X2 n=1 Tax=Trichoplusia ni TaxID=7111 RepID=A0A7E5VBN3_TRINI|nr:uncharacterized protein LOC113492452 isoform X2 [Trichoplusia ni]
MTTLGNTSQITQQLQQDLQNELTTANQLLRLMYRASGATRGCLRLVRTTTSHWECGSARAASRQPSLALAPSCNQVAGAAGDGRIDARMCRAPLAVRYIICLISSRSL